MTEYFNFKNACKYLGFKSANTLKKLISKGLPVAVIDGTKLISKSDIDKFVQAHKVTTK
ncbi:DNA-binding protein [Ligilactobacillus aviarius]|uniref:DNA-binding protein n=1 Tax=Ligilactobacillus aviarius TaxID=1606 RepID=UPI00255B458E|nr:DNA-binding protein [Ligilactobacillus aviarius]